jgi:hypothetical protein
MNVLHATMLRDKGMSARVAFAASLLTLLSLGGCINPTRIQQDYIAQRDKCRDTAQDNAGYYHTQASASQALAVKDKNAVLAKIFSDCMYINGWTVAAPGDKAIPPRQVAGGQDELGALGALQSRQAAARRPQPSAAQQPPVTYIPSQRPLPANRQPVNVPR